MPFLGRTHPTGVCYGRCRIRANSCLSVWVMTGRFALHGRVERGSEEADVCLSGFE